MSRGIILLLSILISLPAFALRVGLSEPRDIDEGEIFWVQVDDKLEENEFNELRYKRIGPSLYVMETNFSSNELKVIASFLKQNDQEKLPKNFVATEYRNMTFKNPQTPSQGGFLLQEKTFSLDDFDWRILSFLLVFLLIYPVMLYLRKRKAAKELKLKKEKLRAFIISAQDSNDFCEIYDQRDELANLITIGADLDDFKKAMRTLYYKPSWSNEEVQQVTKLKDKLAARLR